MSRKQGPSERFFRRRRTPKSTILSASGLVEKLSNLLAAVTAEDFDLLVSLGVFNAAHMNQAVFAFRRYEDASLSYTGIASHDGLQKIGLYDTVVSLEN